MVYWISLLRFILQNKIKSKRPETYNNETITPTTI